MYIPCISRVYTYIHAPDRVRTGREGDVYIVYIYSAGDRGVYIICGSRARFLYTPPRSASGRGRGRVYTYIHMHIHIYTGAIHIYQRACARKRGRSRTYEGDPSSGALLMLGECRSDGQFMA